MRSPLWNIIFMLILTFLILTAYSFSDYRISIGEFEVQKTKIKKSLLSEAPVPIEDTVTKISTDSIPPDSIPVEKPKIALDTTKQRILLIGDSMLEGLMLRLKQYVAFNNHEIKTVIWYSSSTKWYGTSDTLSYFINQWKPSYVFLVLGANELFIRDVKERNQPYIEHIVGQLDTVNYVWIGPPNWTDDTGINDLIVENVGPRKYFPSKDLTLKRTRDGAHPTHSASAIWMDSVASWVMTKSAYPIQLNEPDTTIDCSANVTILQPKR